MRAAVVGMGVVGRATARMLGKEHEIVAYDIADGAQPPEVGACDFAAVCVGTPPAPDGSCDTSQVREALSRLPPSMPVMLRSTVPPGTTGSLGREVICHVPEFMHEREGGAWRESWDVPFLLLGGEPESCAFFRSPLRAVFPGAVHECSSLTAELAKYTANLHWASRVTFVSEMAAVCAAFGADWEDVREAWLLDERVGSSYTTMRGFSPGFGGRCWPKDLSALIAASGAAGHRAGFLSALEEANERFRGPSL